MKMAGCDVMVRAIIRKLEEFNRIPIVGNAKLQLARMDKDELEFYVQVMDPVFWGSLLSEANLAEYQLRRRPNELSLGEVDDERLDKLVTRCLRLTAIKLASFVAMMNDGRKTGGSFLVLEDLAADALGQKNSASWERLERILKSWPSLGHPDVFLELEKIYG